MFNREDKIKNYIIKRYKELSEAQAALEQNFKITGRDKMLNIVECKLEALIEIANNCGFINELENE